MAIMDSKNPRRPVATLGSNRISLLFFPWHLYRQGWVDHNFRFQCLLSSHFSLTAFSASSLQFILYLLFSILLPLFLAQIYCNPPLQFCSSSPRFLSTFWASALFASHSSPFLSTWPAHVNLLLANLFLAFSFTPTSTLISLILLSSALLPPTILLTRLLLFFLGNLDLPLLYPC